MKSIVVDKPEMRICHWRTRTEELPEGVRHGQTNFNHTASEVLRIILRHQLLGPLPLAAIDFPKVNACGPPKIA